MMKWMKFLAAGQSFIGMKSKNSPYRETQRSWLRMVGSICRPTQDPFADQVAGGARSLAVANGSSALTTANEPMGATSDLFKAVEAPLLPQIDPLHELAAAAGPVIPPVRCTKAAPVIPPVRAAAPVIPPVKASAGPTRSLRPTGWRTRRTLIQGELSLDAVKVVRNDLSDADVELVPVQRSRAPVRQENLLAGVLERRLADSLVQAQRGVS